MDYKSEIIEAAYRGVLPDDMVDRMLTKVQEDKCREAIRQADNRIKFNEMYSENDIERGLEIGRINKELHKNQHGEE